MLFCNPADLADFPTANEIEAKTGDCISMVVHKQLADPDALLRTNTLARRCLKSLAAPSAAARRRPPTPGVARLMERGDEGS